MFYIFSHGIASQCLLSVVKFFLDQTLEDILKLGICVKIELLSVSFFIAELVWLSSLSLMQRLMMCAMYPFLLLYTESPFLIFLSSRASLTIKFRSRSSFNTD